MRQILSMLCFIVVSFSAHAKDSQDIAKSSIPSVVTVVMQDSENGLVSQGSGFFVENDKVLTNYHVISGGSKGYVVLGAGSTPIAITKVLKANSKLDLALLSVATKSGAPLSIESGEVSVGEQVYAVGSPLGYTSTFTNGIVSALRKDANRDEIQISAPISHGSSGGPILNSSGKVIGVAVAIVESGQNINFAIPIKHFEELKASTNDVSTPEISQPTPSDTNDVWQQYEAKHHEWRKILDWDKEKKLLTLDQFKSDCEQGNYSSCFNVAHEFRLKSKRSEAKAFFKKLCDAGKATGCFYLGKESYSDGKFKEYVNLSQKACDIGGFACNDLAKIEWYRENYAGWRTFAEKSCNAGNPEGCANLGELYNLMTDAKKRYQSDCTTPTRENAETCRLTAKVYDLSKNYPDSKKLTSQSFLKACKLGDLDTCQNLDFEQISEGKDKLELLQSFETANDINLVRCRNGIMSGSDSAFSLRSACLNVRSKAMGDSLKIFTHFCNKGALWECTFEEQIERTIGENSKTKPTRDKSERLTKQLCAEHALGACNEYIYQLKTYLDCINNKYGSNSNTKTCESKDPRKYAKKEMVAYKKILINLCKDGDQSVCLDLAVEEMMPAYAAIPEN